jgi:hypothetical protein
VIGVRLKSIANAKVIDDETESNVEGFVSKETGAVRAFGEQGAREGDSVDFFGLSDEPEVTVGARICRSDGRGRILQSCRTEVFRDGRGLE